LKTDKLWAATIADDLRSRSYTASVSAHIQPYLTRYKLF